MMTSAVTATVAPRAATAIVPITQDRRRSNSSGSLAMSRATRRKKTASISKTAAPKASQ